MTVNTQQWHMTACSRTGTVTVNILTHPYCIPSNKYVQLNRTVSYPIKISRKYNRLARLYNTQRQLDLRKYSD